MEHRFSREILDVSIRLVNAMQDAGIGPVVGVSACLLLSAIKLVGDNASPDQIHDVWENAVQAARAEFSALDEGEPFNPPRVM